jgi:hypothetical protein
MAAIRGALSREQANGLGHENLSAFVPVEIKDIERLMAERGLSDARLDERRWKVPKP